MLDLAKKDEAQPLKGLIVVLDPGHGQYKTKKGEWLWHGDLWGFDREEHWTNKTPIKSLVREDLDTIELAHHLACFLENQGAQVLATREIKDISKKGPDGNGYLYEYAAIYHAVKEEFLLDKKEDLNRDLRHRALFAAEAKTDLLLSLHFNVESKPGFIAYYNESEDQRSKDLALCICRYLQAGNLLTAKNKGAHEANQIFWKKGKRKLMNNFVLTSMAKMPTVIIEFASIRDPHEGPKIANEKWKKTQAEAVTQAVIEWANA